MHLKGLPLIFFTALLLKVSSLQGAKDEWTFISFANIVKPVNEKRPSSPSQNNSDTKNREEIIFFNNEESERMEIEGQLLLELIMGSGYDPVDQMHNTEFSESLFQDNELQDNPSISDLNQNRKIPLFNETESEHSPFSFLNDPFFSELEPMEEEEGNDSSTSMDKRAPLEPQFDFFTPNLDPNEEAPLFDLEELKKLIELTQNEPFILTSPISPVNQTPRHSDSTPENNSLIFIEETNSYFSPREAAITDTSSVLSKDSSLDGICKNLKTTLQKIKDHKEEIDHPPIQQWIENFLNIFENTPSFINTEELFITVYRQIHFMAFSKKTISWKAMKFFLSQQRKENPQQIEELIQKCIYYWALLLDKKVQINFSEPNESSALFFKCTQAVRPRSQIIREWFIRLIKGAMAIPQSRLHPEQQEVKAFLMKLHSIVHTPNHNIGYNNE